MAYQQLTDVKMDVILSFLMIIGHFSRLVWNSNRKQQIFSDDERDA